MSLCSLFCYLCILLCNVRELNKTICVQNPQSRSCVHSSRIFFSFTPCDERFLSFASSPQKALGRRGEARRGGRNEGSNRSVGWERCTDSSETRATACSFQMKSDPKKTFFSWFVTRQMVWETTSVRASLWFRKSARVECSPQTWSDSKIW